MCSLCPFRAGLRTGGPRQMLTVVSNEYAAVSARTDKRHRLWWVQWLRSCPPPNASPLVTEGVVCPAGRTPRCRHRRRSPFVAACPGALTWRTFPAERQPSLDVASFAETHFNTDLCAGEVATAAFYGSSFALRRSSQLSSAPGSCSMITVRYSLAVLFAGGVPRGLDLQWQRAPVVAQRVVGRPVGVYLFPVEHA